ncbi:MAG: DUF4007 family protein [Candidatus Cloacimonetes bacterium]|jgi:hypothetical protein|nr:DUF4007 family protein [Candidatus Cloacimonadota bacterium]
MQNKTKHNRLPRNFHSSFKAERQYINALLKFVAEGSIGDIHMISRRTGIPTGESTGKVLPTIDYCSAMGLIEAKRDKEGVIKADLTDFGRVVLKEDPYLLTEISQWVCHLNLCNIYSGADVWHNVFWAEYHSIGDRFSREDLEEMLQHKYGKSNRSLIGPMITMYQDHSSFKTCGALTTNNNLLERKHAPIENEMIRMYGAWMIDGIERYFPNENQISTSDLDKHIGWLSITGWHGKEMVEVLDMMEIKGIFKVDRHMMPWIISPLIGSTAAYHSAFDDLI